MDIMTHITDHLSWPTILFPGRRLMVPRSGARPLETLTTGSAPSPPTRCKSKLAIWGIQFTWNPQFTSLYIIPIHVLIRSFGSTYV